MKLNESETRFLRQLLGRIDITLIPEASFLTAVTLYERLGQESNREERTES